VGFSISQQQIRASDFLGTIDHALFGTDACAAVVRPIERRPGVQSASIKPNTNTVRRGILVRVEPSGRLITVDSPLVLLIKNAYGVQDFQVIGGPSWINTDGYDIEA
jgi:hypothetical protein